MHFLGTIPRLACAGIYISTSSDDEFLVPFIIVLVSMLIASMIFLMIAFRYAKNRQNKDQGKPLQAIQGAKVVEKRTARAPLFPQNTRWICGKAVGLYYRPISRS